MKSVKIVKVNSAKNNFTHYIGRAWAGIHQSEFHNPFHVGVDGTRDEVLEKFIIYWYAPEQYWLREHAVKVITENTVLGCWCKPLRCHGDIIAGYVEWKNQESQLCL